MAPRPTGMVVYTIGHSNRSLEDFLDVLDRFKIKVLVDVRRFPTSKWDWFKRENLQAALTLKGIRYLYLGEQLGGYRKGGYHAHMKTELFTAGVEQLINMAAREQIAVMCSERIVLRCHRRFISLTLQARGIEVIHIVDKQRTFQIENVDSSTGPRWPS